MKNIKWLQFALLALALGACGAIPGAYRGNYQGSNGTILKLSGTKGRLTTKSEIINSKVRPLAFEALSLGEPGIYVQPNPVNNKLLDIFWLRPKMNTRQEAGGMVWYTSEVYYSLFDANQKIKLDKIQLVYSDEGTVMLDVPTGTWQVGWPASPRNVTFTRLKK